MAKRNHFKLTLHEFRWSVNALRGFGDAIVPTRDSAFNLGRLGAGA